MTFTLALVASAVLALPAVGAGPMGGGSRSDNRPATGAVRCVGTGAVPRSTSLMSMRRAMLCLLNRARRTHRLPTLRRNRDLQRSAAGHSNDMVRHRYFSHDGSHGSTLTGRIARTGYLVGSHFYLVGENIGGGPGRHYGSPIQVFRAWMHSPPHRANVLDPSFRDAGIGVSRGFPWTGGGRDSVTYTLDLGVRR